MAGLGRDGQLWRNNSIDRHSVPRTSIYSQSNQRTTGATTAPLFPPPYLAKHSRNNSYSPTISAPVLDRTNSRRRRSNSLSESGRHSTTFAPRFITSGFTAEDHHKVDHIEGENDFSGKKYVWLRDEEKAFVKGYVVQELEGERLIVQCEDGSKRDVEAQSVDKVNPAKFDRADDMAELTHLNEASVVHNLHLRYQADLIYTYSGLFLVAVNPYCPLPIYTRDYINTYRRRTSEDTKPHIFAVADEAFRSLVEEGENQSILVTGESGAGKTENTKKVIQYLAAVATSEFSTSTSGGNSLSNLSQQILRANPILEAFGNAQTVRNNNSSRFGKFIRIQFTRSGQIAGAYIDWYLLEKSRVVKINANERNYHIFYQLLRGADDKTKHELLLMDQDVDAFEFTKHGNDAILGLSERDEWNTLMEAFHTMGFSEVERKACLRNVAAVLHMGNIFVSKESLRGDQASFDAEAQNQARKVCQLLGIPVEQFIKALLHPRVKAGREWVEKVQTPAQVRVSIDALAKGIYERSFGKIVDCVNERLNRGNVSADDTYFIGVLDIAGFEIFEHNSFEQLCINYTNEKLQQFFNHHMFVLEQEEYTREQIEWKFIDFGKDLQPTIDLIEVTNPIGIFSCLDEDSVMPKATDKSFTEKLHSLWDRNTPKYRRSLLTQGFVLTHYAAEVDYSTEGWLEKNKDPLNDNVTRLLAGSTDKHIAMLFADCAETEDEIVGSRNRVKRGLFRTVAQRHKEQLSTLMAQLHSTHPHFVRCILPNHKKRPKLLDANLVLDQLRCNGVLEGIRIARTGFPNRLSFPEFRSRYEVLCSKLPRDILDGHRAASMILEKLSLDSSCFRVGLTKVFFRAGVLAELEDQRDTLIREIMSRFQSMTRGFMQRRAINKRLYRAEAARIIQINFQAYLKLLENPWWKLFVRMRPLLGATKQSNELKKRDEKIRALELKMQQDAKQRQAIEEERRRADTEIAKVQQTLEGERALALDKEDIFKRLQDREAELSEKLAGALDDQASLEDHVDELLSALKAAEGQVAALRDDLARAGDLMNGLLEEKQNLAQEISTLHHNLEKVEQSHRETSEAEDRFQRDIRVLNSQLGLKDRKIQDLESRVLKSDQESDIQLKTTAKELQIAQVKADKLSKENSIIRQQLADVSSTSTVFEDALRLKDSELLVMRTEIETFKLDRKNHDEESRKMSIRYDELQKRFRERDLHASQLEKEAVDARRLVQERLIEDGERKTLETELHNATHELSRVQADLDRERQSREDVIMLAEHKFNNLKCDYDSLNQSKLIIEKELYANSDVLRRTAEARSTAERERKEHQEELRNLRQKYLELQESSLEAENAAERALSRLTSERLEALREKLDEKTHALERSEADRRSLNNEVGSLKQLIADSDAFRMQHDSHKDRLERELVTIKGRLTASENDNRALLNKLQQKNLDIARSNSRASDTQRTRIGQLQTEKSLQEEKTKKLSRDLEEAKLTITTLEKQKEKLTLTLEDLNHDINKEHMSSRSAQKTSSTMNLQLAEANRKLETERQMKTQAQLNSRTIQNSLERANSELADCRDQLVLLQKVFDPSIDLHSMTYQTARPEISKTVDLARKLEDAEKATRVATERYARAEAQLNLLKTCHEDIITEVDATRHLNTKRGLLEEMNENQVNRRSSLSAYQPSSDQRDNLENVKPRPSRFSTPIQRHISNTASESARSDRTVDTVSYKDSMDLVSQLDLVSNQLQMSEMRNRHLQDQIDRSPPKKSWDDDSPSARRAQRLERANSRLHGMLTDSEKKVSALENSIRTGLLTLNEVQSKSHEELYDLLNAQEQSRRSLLQVHNEAVSELVDAKTVFDELKHAKASVEVELRDSRAELDDLKQQQSQEEASKVQLLEEFADLQLKLDSETSKLLDATSTVSLQKARANEYYQKLEQAEVAVLKASRAEQFAKSQAREAEETCATIMSERAQIDALVEDLQRQLRAYEERVEDVSTDLEGALQSKRALKNELEDYRNQRAHDIEDKESSMEQMRRKYQTELSKTTAELELERENSMTVRGENHSLRDELEELRAKWDDEILNSSTWSKEKARLETALESLSSSRDEAMSAHNEAQSKIVTLLSQVRSLRSNVDDVAAERDSLATEKKSLETRLKQASERLDELSRSESPSMRDAANTDRHLLQLKAGLAQQEDIASAAVGKMRRSEALVQEMQKDITTERETNARLRKEKAGLDKSVKDLQLRLVDLETKGIPSASQDVRFLHGRIQELERHCEELQETRNKEIRSVRNVDRTVRDLHAQLERREKANMQLAEDVDKARDKMERLLRTIDELQSSDSNNQLQAKRAERELKEEKERNLLLERELEATKERETLRRNGTLRALSDLGSSRGGRLSISGDSVRRPQSMRGGSVGPEPALGIGVPQRKSSLSKGSFL